MSETRMEQILAAGATQQTIENERINQLVAAMDRLTVEVRKVGEDVRPVVVDAKGRAMFGARVFTLLEKIKLQQAISIAILGATIATMGGLSLALVVLAVSQPAAVLAFVVALFNLAPG